jgi:PKHD-type hydroxylase
MTTNAASAVSAYWKWDAAVPEPLLVALEQSLQGVPMSAGEVFSGDAGSSARRSDVHLFPGWHWMAGVLMNHAHWANRQAGWGYTLGLADALQFACYGPGQFYDWHTDADLLSAQPLTRKLTAVCLLSAPQEYAGGALEIASVPDMPALGRGAVIVFPSVLAHRVTPVTAGLRRSLTCWTVGPNLR